MFRNPKDFGSGLIFLFVGCVGVTIARNYPLGAADKMGPGYFPMVLGGLLVLNGAALLVRAFWKEGTGLTAFSWRGIFFSLASLILFGMLLKPAGLPIAVLILVLVSAAASREFRIGPSLALAVGLSVFCVFVFLYALDLPLPLLGTWFPD